MRQAMSPPSTSPEAGDTIGMTQHAEKPCRRASSRSPDGISSRLEAMTVDRVRMALAHGASRPPCPPVADASTGSTSASAPASSSTRSNTEMALRKRPSTGSTPMMARVPSNCSSTRRAMSRMVAANVAPEAMDSRTWSMMRRSVMSCTCTTMPLTVSSRSWLALTASSTPVLPSARR